MEQSERRKSFPLLAGSYSSDPSGSASHMKLMSSQTPGERDSREQRASDPES